MNAEGWTCPPVSDRKSRVSGSRRAGRGGIRRFTERVYGEFSKQIQGPWKTTTGVHEQDNKEIMILHE